MKKYILTLAVLVLGITQVAAQRLYVDDVVEIPQGGTTKVAIKYNTGGETIKGFGIAFVLPEGITTVKNDAGEPDYEIDPSNPGFRQLAAANDGWSGVSTSGQFTGTEGTIFYAFLSADASLPIGTVFQQVKVNKLMVTVARDNGKNESVYLDDLYITIKIVEDRVIFDENATTLPYYTAGENKNIRMIRTIKKDYWSTIVLPFTLSASTTNNQVSEIFGSDAQFAEFDGFEVDYGEDEENVIPFGITIKFKTKTFGPKASMGGGNLYLVKTTKNIEQFEATNVKLVNAVTTTSKDDEFNTTGTFTGSLVKTKVPADGLFISDNQFWYSTGATNIKGFRGWFELNAVLGKETEDFSVKMSIDGIFTDIQDMQLVKTNDAVYTIDGKKMNNDVTKLPKGVYIIDGKKVAIK